MLPISIFLIDDHALFRSGLRMVLATGMQPVDVQEAGSLDQALRSADATPDVVLLDIQLQGLNGLDGIALLKRKWPKALVVMLSSDATPETRRAAMARGADGFVSKADTADLIINVIRQLLAQDPAARPVAPIEASAGPHLTPRQFEVLDLLCQGLSNKMIGRRLSLSENTVRGHVQAVLGVLQVSSRSEAAFAARRSGLIG